VAEHPKNSSFAWSARRRSASDFPPVGDVAENEDRTDHVALVVATGAPP